jgi:predicted extracellular nuclease
MLVLSEMPADWRPLEGMHVHIAAPLTVSGTDRLQRHGELTASFGGRLWQPSEIAAPGSAEYTAVVADNARRVLPLDDAGIKTIDGQPKFLPAHGAPRSGSTILGAEGIVHWHNGRYRLYLTQPLTLPMVLHEAPRPPSPQVPGRLRIASLNLENLFNGDGRGGGFPTQRGASTLAQYQAQLAKLVATLHALDPDAVALMELENDGYGPESSIAQLVDALNAGDGTAGDWRFVDAGKGPGDNPIRVGMIYRAGRLVPVGGPAVLEDGPFGERSRAPLAQAFRTGDGGEFALVANHLKSKGCTGADGADADQGDGQACWNATRRDSVARLDAWLRSDPTGHGREHAIVLGDFNAYAQEDPIRDLRAAGWVDALAAVQGNRPYSYVYDGHSGRLDHALLSPALAKRLRGAAEWHSNADEPEDNGYAKRNVPGPWRSSDHDPLLLGFDL